MFRKIRKIKDYLTEEKLPSLKEINGWGWRKKNSGELVELIKHYSKRNVNKALILLKDLEKLDLSPLHSEVCLGKKIPEMFLDEKFLFLRQKEGERFDDPLIITLIKNGQCERLKHVSLKSWLKITNHSEWIDTALGEAINITGKAPIEITPKEASKYLKSAKHQRGLEYVKIKAELDLREERLSWIKKIVKLGKEYQKLKEEEKININ